MLPESRLGHSSSILRLGNIIYLFIIYIIYTFNFIELIIGNSITPRMILFGGVGYQHSFNEVIIP
jgi:hypothetical protein